MLKIFDSSYITNQDVLCPFNTLTEKAKYITFIRERPRLVAKYYLSMKNEGNLEPLSKESGTVINI